MNKFEQVSGDEDQMSVAGGNAVSRGRVCQGVR